MSFWKKLFGSGNSKKPVPPIKQAAFSSPNKSASPSHNADRERQSNANVKALWNAIDSSDLGALETLIATGADVNAKNEEGNTALHLTAKLSHEDITKLLLTQKADINSRNLKMQTPLHMAAINDQISVAKTLIANRAKTYLRDNDGRTPWDHIHYKSTNYKAWERLLVTKRLGKECEDLELLSVCKWDKLRSTYYNKNGLKVSEIIVTGDNVNCVEVVDIVKEFLGRKTPFGYNVYTVSQNSRRGPTSTTDCKALLNHQEEKVLIFRRDIVKHYKSVDNYSTPKHHKDMCVLRVSSDKFKCIEWQTDYSERETGMG